MANQGKPRRVSRILTARATMDGAGVYLKRSIGSVALDFLDPFLLLDEFRSDDPDDYIRGFPDHPHRGIETVTYMIHGAVRHRDSLGNEGVIEGGDVQWMTSGRGIIHAEMPEQRQGLLWGYQLWVNLPASQKMQAPRYQEISSQRIPAVETDDGSVIRIIAGEFEGVRGPATDIAAEPTYLDVGLPPGREIVLPTEKNQTVFAFIMEGDGEFGPAGESPPNRAGSSHLVLFEPGDVFRARAGDHSLRFLFLSGKPFDEPIARWGPFVMNTQEQIEQTLDDLRQGTFLDPEGSPDGSKQRR